MSSICRKSLQKNGWRALDWASFQARPGNAACHSRYLHSSSSVCQRKGNPNFMFFRGVQSHQSSGISRVGCNLRFMSDSKPSLEEDAQQQVNDEAAATDTVEEVPVPSLNIDKVILQCIDARDTAQAHDMLLKKIDAGDELDVDTYTGVMDAWLSHQDDAIQNMDSDSLVLELHRAAEHANDVLDLMQAAAKKESNDDLLPTSHHFDAVLKAWCQVSQHGCIHGSTFAKGVPQRAQYVLDRMEKQAKGGVRPSIESYNRVMEAWGKSDGHLRASMAHNIYQRVTKGGANLALGIEPNVNTHRIMMYAWCHSGQKRAAFNATMHLTQMQDDLKYGVEEMKPTIEDYHMVLEAWSRAEGKVGYRRATSLLKVMDEFYMERLTEVRPDETCYKYVLGSLARTPIENLGKLADGIIEQMNERLMIPDTVCYGAAIRAWRNSAVAEKRRRPHEDAKRANELLEEMETAFHRTSAVVIKPTTTHYNDVIESWSVCNFATLTLTAAEMSEKLLIGLENAFREGDKDMKPTTESYLFVLNAYATSSLSDKVNRALDVFNRLKAQSEGGNDSTKVTVEAANAMMSVCASATSGSEDAKKRAFHIAFEVLAKLPLKEQGPNCTSYKILLDACVTLLPSGQERTRALQSIFKNCCLAGLVDTGVLERFKETVPSDVYNQLVVAVAISDDSGKMVPEEWTRHLGYKVLTVDGRRPPPLSIEGSYVITPAILENKMRKLRKRKNQRLLRAGRLRTKSIA